MNTIETIFNRVSTRDFLDKEISNEDLHTLLKAAMSGPSCVNARDWSFIVVKNKETLNKMADANGRPAEPLRKANVGILICGDLERAFKGAPDYWVIDGAIAAQNLILAAESLEIGSVWLGTWPQMDRVKRQAELFNLPETQIPHSIIALGYPAKENTKEKLFYEESQVHFEKW